MSEDHSTEAAAGPEEVIREFLLDVLGAMGLDAGVDIQYSEEAGSWRVEIVGPDAGEVIGRYGDMINALQYLTTLVILRRTGEHTRVLLDAQGYRERRQNVLTRIARELAAEVASAGQEAELDPLGAFERRIIHNALTDHPDVITYSEGDEPERRVIIAPRAR